MLLHSLRYNRLLEQATKGGAGQRKYVHGALSRLSTLHGSYQEVGDCVSQKTRCDKQGDLREFVRNAWGDSRGYNR